MSVRPPLRSFYRNIVFGRDGSDAWGVYRLDTCSYEGLTRQEKLELWQRLAGFAYGIEADIHLQRVTRAWSVDSYLAGAEMLVGPQGDRAQWREYLQSHRAALADQQTARPEVYLSVRLAPPTGSLSAQALGVFSRSPRDTLRDLADQVGLGEKGAIPGAKLRDLLRAERRVYDRVRDYLACEPASTLQLQWLVRRAFCRGAGEPDLDELFEPQALVFLDKDGAASDTAEATRFQPLEVDILRLYDPVFVEDGRTLRCASEQGDSWQAQLVVGALPRSVLFPGREAELLFAPLEAVAFPVDACLSCKWIPNEQARTLVRRKIIDADNTYREEAIGDHGASADTEKRVGDARDLEEYLTSTAHPPLLLSTIALAVGADGRDMLEERVEALRREYGAIKLHRPYGDQLALFCQQFPGQHTRVPAYQDYFTVEQAAATVPVGTHHVGSDDGPYIGYVRSGSRQPVLLDTEEPSRRSLPPSFLIAGTLGSGKTMCAQHIAYQAFLRGARLVVVDPKPDWSIHLLPGMQGQVELIELSADERWQGLLDPMRIAPADTAEDLAATFLTDILPGRGGEQAALWEIEIRAAVQHVLQAAANDRSQGTCLAVLDALESSDKPEAQSAGRALRTYAGSGLPRLGFADPARPPDRAGTTRATVLRIRNLQLPIPGTPRGEFTQAERIGQAVLRLVAAYAMHLMSGLDREGIGKTPKLLAFDEAWMLLGDSAGAALIDKLTRWGRSMWASSLLISQLVSDAERLDNFLGCRLIFGQESEAEAQAALRLLRLDADDDQLVREVLSNRRGACFIRDFDGRVAPVQIDLVDPRLIELLDTTPGRHHEDSDDAVQAVPSAAD